MIAGSVKKLKRFPHFAESSSESKKEEEKVDLESDEAELLDEELLADGSIIELNSIQ